MNVMIFAEQENGKVHQVTYELLGKGRELADKSKSLLSSVLMGYEMEKEAEELIHYGADKVFLYDHPSLKDFDVVLYKENLVRLVREEKPEIFLMGATHIGRSLGPRVAAALETGLTADCVELDVDENGSLIQIRPAFSGNIMAKIRTRTRPQMATVRYKVMKKMEVDPTRKGEIIRKKGEIIEETGIKILGKSESSEVDLAEAEIVVSCGRGLRRPEDVKLIEMLADSLNGVLGSSRPLVDEGWIGRKHQVGFSGNTVKPKIYIACGISGAPQHLFGMRDSEIIIAVNKDPSAPIFRVSDYGVIGDVYEILPPLMEEIKRRKQQGGC